MPVKEKIAGKFPQFGENILRKEYSVTNSLVFKKKIIPQNENLYF
jgi:hypothetical protein